MDRKAKVNVHLEINPEAWAILRLLAEKSFSAKLDLRTRAWYNGRERGVSVEATNYKKGESLVITFGEVRNSDALFVDNWKMEGLLDDVPTVADFPARAYKNRKTFGSGKYAEVVEYICSILEPPPRTPKAK